MAAILSDGCAWLDAGGLRGPAAGAAPAGRSRLVKGNILRLADAEWNAFGGQTISYENGRERIDPVGIWEDERRGSPRIGQYWRSVARGMVGL